MAQLGPWRPEFTPRLAILACLLALVAFARAMLSAPVPETARFRISFPSARSNQPRSNQLMDGRLLLLLSTDGSQEPRMQINDTLKTQIVFGMDVDAMRPGEPVVFDERANGYPIAKLADVPAGDYYVQAVLHRYETFHRADEKTMKLPMDRGEGQHWNLAPGNLYSKSQRIHVAPGMAATISLDQEIPPIKPPEDTRYIRHIRIKSELLTRFWGRPMYLGAHVLVPEGFDEHPKRTIRWRYLKDISLPISKGFARSRPIRT